MPEQAVVDRQRVQARYPNARVIVLDDDHNTFQHVVEVLVRHIPGHDAGPGLGAGSPDRWTGIG